MASTEFDTEVDVDQDEDTTTDQGDDDAGGTGGDAPEETTEQLRDRITKMERALAKANREAAALRVKGKAKPARTASADDDHDSAGDRREAEKWRTRTLQAEARAALAGAGAPADRLGRLARLVDLADLDLDDEGNVVGLNDQIEQLREDFPELFRRQRAAREPERPPVPRLTGGNRQGAATAPAVDPTLLQVRALRGTSARGR